MSYDIAVWREESPIASQAAKRRYLRLCEGVESMPACASVARFCAELLTSYPQPKPRDANAVWASPVHQDEACALLAVATSRAGTVVPVILRLAAKHELVCYDPQREVVVYPPTLAALPHLRLETCDGSVVDDPSDQDIRRTLEGLSPDNWYASLERQEGWFVQVGIGNMANAASGYYALELREGADARHRRSVVRTLADVVEAFCAYARGDTSWEARFAWTPAF